MSAEGRRSVHVTWEDPMRLAQAAREMSGLDPIGVVHGGLLATLLDSAMACAVHSLLPAGTGYTTVELHVNLVRAVGADSGRLRAEAETVHRGSRVATAQGRVVDAKGRLYAHGSTTCLILAPER